MAAGPIAERNQDATIYVGGLDDKVSEGLLWELFVQAGPVVNVHMPKDRVTQQHQGYGFVEFMGEEDADYAIKIMNMIKLFGKPIRVNKASAHQKNLDVGANIFIGNLDPEVDEKLLYDTFSAFGVILQTPKIMRDPDTGNSKGYAFINFASFEASDAAIEAMNGQYLCNRSISISYAFKKDSKGERHGTAAERLLAAQNPLSQADKPHQGDLNCTTWNVSATSGYACAPSTTCASPSWHISICATPTQCTSHDICTSTTRVCPTITPYAPTPLKASPSRTATPSSFRSSSSIRWEHRKFWSSTSLWVSSPAWHATSTLAGRTWDASSPRNASAKTWSTRHASSSRYASASSWMETTSSWRSSWTSTLWKATLSTSRPSWTPTHARNGAPHAWWASSSSRPTSNRWPNASWSSSTTWHATPSTWSACVKWAK
ncbi:putative splicing factor 3B subunit 4, partial [Penaeus vannamei]